MNQTSLKKLSTADIRLQTLAKKVDETFPIQVICGHRDNADQLKAYQEGRSKAKPGESKHNKKPSQAIDCVPDPDRNPATIDWGDIKSFELMCIAFEQAADELDIKIRLGRDFSFADYPHIELVSIS